MKIKYRQTVFVDIDGVMANTEDEFCERFGYENRNLHNLFDRVPNVDPALIEEFLQSPETYEKLVPIFGGAILLPTILRNRGYYVVLMTSRPRKLAEVTREWLEGYDIQYNELWFAPNKQIAIGEFNRMYPKRRGLLLIDDTVSNLVGLPDGVVGVAWSQLWNLDYWPRMRYNEEVMRLEIMESQDGKWEKF